MALFGPGVNGLFSIPGCCMINLWLLNLLSKNSFRIGAGSSKGFGKIKIIEIIEIVDYHD